MCTHSPSLVHARIRVLLPTFSVTAEGVRMISGAVQGSVPRSAFTPGEREREQQGTNKVCDVTPHIACIQSYYVTRL